MRVDCPYCKKWSEVSSDFWSDGDEEEVFCASCGKEFLISISMIIDTESWPYCDKCGNVTVDEAGEVCDQCEEEALKHG